MGGFRFLAIALLSLSGIMESADAQQTATRVSREQSGLLLDMPGLSTGTAGYEYVGWNPQYSVELHYAYVGPTSGQYPRGQVNMRVLSKGRLWSGHGRLDEAYVKAWPFFKDRMIKMLPESRNIANDYVKTSLFKSDDSECMAFSMRRLSTPGGAGTTDSGTRGFDGVYCAMPTLALSPELVNQVLSGIYYRESGAVHRANELNHEPVPSSVAR